jgi:hypothetical protein
MTIRRCDIVDRSLLASNPWKGILTQLHPVARRELVNPDFAHGFGKTMCKFRAATGPRRSTNADRADEIGILYKQTRRE